MVAEEATFLKKCKILKMLKVASSAMAEGVTFFVASSAMAEEATFLQNIFFEN